MQIALRPAAPEDFEYCRALYFAEMGWIIEKLNLDPSAHAEEFEQQWAAEEIEIITLDGVDVGFLQTIRQPDGVFVAQIIVAAGFQHRGIGTEVVKRQIAEAARAGGTVRLAVAKINPAVRLYERLGFRVVDEDERKFYMAY